MNKNYLAVIDFETVNLQKDIYSPCELACLMIEPRTLSILPDSEYCSLMKPLDFTKIDPKALEINKKTILQLQSAPNQDVVWQSFVQYLKRYNIGSGKIWDKPIVCGFNIVNFDLPIINALAKHYGNVKNNEVDLFHPVFHFDVMQMIHGWFYNSGELQKYSLDTVRKYMGIDGTLAHTALQDIKDTAKLLLRLLKFQRNQFPKADFKNAFVDRPAA